jgi:hypothetical protein
VSRIASSEEVLWIDPKPATSKWCGSISVRNARILEVRAYFIASPESSIELAAFPYAERGYLLMAG